MFEANEARVNFTYAKILPKLLFKLSMLSFSRLTGTDFLIKKIPVQPLITCSIHVTDNCNSRCITCNQWKEHKTDEMTTSEVKMVLEQLRGIGCISIGLSGGEPLLRNDIGELGSYAKRLGFRSISITTNGLLLARRAEEIVESGITSISISIDGIQETNDLIRGVEGSFSKCLEAIDKLNEIRREKPSFSIGILTTLLRQNVDEIPGILNLCEEKGLSWSFNLLDTSPYFFKHVTTDNISLKNNLAIDRVLDYIMEKKKRNPRLIRTHESSIEHARHYLKTGKINLPCYLGLFGVFIGSKTEVYSQCYAKPPLGTLREKQIKDIINSDEYHTRMLEMYRKECIQCTCNYGFSVRIEQLVTAKLKKLH